MNKSYLPTVDSSMIDLGMQRKKRRDKVERQISKSIAPGFQRQDTKDQKDKSLIEFKNDKDPIMVNDRIGRNKGRFHMHTGSKLGMIKKNPIQMPKISTLSQADVLIGFKRGKIDKDMSVTSTNR